MFKLSFKGGIHPPENKHFTEEKPIERIPLPSQVIIPLHQHTGAPCKPLVAVGDNVQAGQKIGESTGYISANVHASITGVVKSIEPQPHPALPNPVPAVVIEGNGEEPNNLWSKENDWKALTNKDILEKIHEAGITGMGGAAFPSHVKLAPPEGKVIDTLIINGVECEPYLTSDHRLMLEHPREILKGILILLKLLGVKKGYIGIEKNKPDAIALFKEVIAKELSSAEQEAIQVFALKVKYPQGAEKQLIKALVNREVPGGSLPFDVGVVVHNVGTTYAIYEAVVKQKPLFERVVTVSGDAVKEPKNLLVPVGTLFSFLIDYCGGFNTEAPLKLIMGGPMMGIAQYTDAVPVVKGTSGILALKYNAKLSKEAACVRCGKCVDICPMYLQPYKIADYAALDKFELCVQYGLKDCMECGSCAYICSSHRKLVHLIKYAKMNLVKKK